MAKEPQLGFRLKGKFHGVKVRILNWIFSIRNIILWSPLVCSGIKMWKNLEIILFLDEFSEMTRWKSFHEGIFFVFPESSSGEFKFNHLLTHSNRLAAWNNGHWAISTVHFLERFLFCTKRNQKVEHKKRARPPSIDIDSKDSNRNGQQIVAKMRFIANTSLRHSEWQYTRVCPRRFAS